MRPARNSVALGLILAALAVAWPTPATAQDVELLGRTYGTRPPDAYFERLTAEPEAFEFQRGWLRRRDPTRGVESAGGREGLEAIIGRPGTEVAGTFRLPLLLGLFADTPGEGPYAPATAQAHFFDGPNPTGTITDYYDEISGGRVELRADALPWLRSGLTRSQVTGGSSGLGGGSQVGVFVLDLLSQADAGGVDWGLYDNDGPDGIPNSGDDDGFVDVLAVLHPTPGAECNGDPNRVWSHRFSLTGSTGQTFATSTPSARPGLDFIRVEDYTIQPAFSCFGPMINEIGVFAHELGHAFGLPDLYSTGASDHAGAGGWDLMATGSWGCRGAGFPNRPCHMGAWSKAQLGWVEVVTIPAGDDRILDLDPVETSEIVYRIDALDGSGEYFLLENRQPVGFDGGLARPGLLIWHIDPSRVAARLQDNRVNADPNRMGVWLRQADGLDHLSIPGGGRGDAGDPFPGSTGNTSFHTASSPSSDTHSGVPSGTTLVGMEEVGGTLRFRVVTGERILTLRSTGAPPGSPFVQIDGVLSVDAEPVLSAVPFRPVELVALPGVEESPGTRVGFLGWSDGGLRERVLPMPLEDLALTAEFGGREHRVRIGLETLPPGAPHGIAPGEVRITPGGGEWFDEGSGITVLAEPRTGFEFEGWAGGFAGSGNPVSAVVTSPLSAEAQFRTIFRVVVPSSLSLVGAAEAEVPLTAENGNLPLVWEIAGGILPEGMTLEPDGRLTGAPLVEGEFVVRARARDAIGLSAEAELAIEVEAPPIDAARLLAPFLATGMGPTDVEATFLDRSGNRNGRYDIGDLRAFFLAHPELSSLIAPNSMVPGGSR